MLVSSFVVQYRASLRRVFLQIRCLWPPMCALPGSPLSASAGPRHRSRTGVGAGSPDHCPLGRPKVSDSALERRPAVGAEGTVRRPCPNEEETVPQRRLAKPQASTTTPTQYCRRFLSAWPWWLASLGWA